MKPLQPLSNFPRFNSFCWLLLGLGLGAFLNNRPLSAADAPPEAVAAAKAGLPGFLSLIPADAKPLYGFAKDSDLSEARLGTPLLLHEFKQAALHSNQVSQSVSSLLAPTTMWYFPVLLHGETKAMLVVDWHQNAWRAVSLGYADLGKEWNQVSEQWPLTKGFHPQLIAVFQAHEHYFTVPEVNDRNLTRIVAPWDKTGPAGAPSVIAAQSPDRYAALGSLARELANLKSKLAAARPGPN